MTSIQYQNTAEDLKDFYDYYFLETKEGRQAVIEAYKGYLSGVFLVALVVWGFSNSVWIMLELLLLAGLVAIIIMGFRPIHWLARKMAQKYTNYYANLGNSIFNLPKQIEFSDKYFAGRNDQESVIFFSWKMIKQVVVKSSYTYIFCGSKSVYIVPHRTFSSKSGFENFNNELLEFHSNPPSASLPALKDLLIL